MTPHQQLTPESQALILAIALIVIAVILRRKLWYASLLSIGLAVFFWLAAVVLHVFPGV